MNAKGPSDMPKPVHLTLACNIYDRSQPIVDGTIGIEGCDLTFVPLPPEEAHLRAFTGADFDVTELSMGSHLIATAAGGSPYVGLPAFISRSFRHSCIFIRKDRGIQSGADLRDKVVGVPEYQMTAAIWMRGILSQDFGVPSDQIAWRTGGMNAPGRKERMALNLPASFDVKPIGDDSSLSDALADGRLDAVITARTPACFERGDPTIGRLFENYRVVEEDYFTRTGIFPIMHGLGVRRNLVEEHPWLPRSIYKAFLEAKMMALGRFRETGSLAVSHPWISDERDRLVRLMGADFWPYGIEPNRVSLEAMVRYALEQGLIGRPVSVDELLYTNVSDRPFAL
jgi:4,5-dihydroxyphthalate decarboxylase